MAKALFASGITRTYEWRVDQLDRMALMIRENEQRFQEAMAKDFKTASQRSSSRPKPQRASQRYRKPAEGMDEAS